MPFKYRYHVTLNDDKDIFEVEQKGDLPTEVFRTFGVTMCVPDMMYKIQMWDPEFEDWCNVTIPSLPDKAKVRFVGLNNTVNEAEKEIIPESSLPISPVVEEFKSEAVKEIVTQSSTLPTIPDMLEDSLNAQLPSTCSKPGDPGPCATNPTGKDNHTVKLTTSLRPWPAQFELPVFRFPRTLREALEEKKPMYGGLLSQLTTAIYEEMTQYTFYPTSAQYNEMARSLVMRYPYLGQGLASTDSKTLWKHAIEQKIRNSRRRLDSDVPVVQAKKRKSKDGVVKDLPTASRNQWGVKHFLPTRPIEEDEDSVLNHMNWMKVEHNKTQQNERKISLLLSQTFADRRKMVVKDLASVADIKKEFPCLFCSAEIQNEFERLTEFRIEKLLLTGVGKYQDAILHTTKASDLKSSVTSAIAATKDTYLRCAVKAEGVLMLTAQLLGEKLNLLAVEKDKMQPGLKHPLFTHSGNLLNSEVDSQIEVQVEGVVLCKPECVIDAFAEVLSAYYVFNISYPKELFKTLTFLQRIVLNLQDTTNIPVRVLSITKQLNNYLARC